MRIIFTLITTLLLSANLWACSIYPEPFCKTVDSSRTLIYGRIIDTIPHATRVQVFNVYRGMETRDTITVWNTMYFCMSWNEVSLSEYGIGDTLFFVLPLIDSIVHDWDVVGDYKWQNIDEEELLLQVYGDSVRGFINGIRGFWQVGTFKYELGEFIEWLESGEGCSSIKIVSVDEVSLINNISIYPNPTADYIAINNLPLNATLEILSIDGQHVGDVSMSENRFSTAHLAAGSYLLKISYEGETAFRRIVKL